jgi:hypothetical protein
LLCAETFYSFKPTERSKTTGSIHGGSATVTANPVAAAAALAPAGTSEVTVALRERLTALLLPAFTLLKNVVGAGNVALLEDIAVVAIASGAS